jgi:hypothetical protein
VTRIMWWMGWDGMMERGGTFGYSFFLSSSMWRDAAFYRSNRLKVSLGRPLLRFSFVRRTA